MRRRGLFLLVVIAVVAAVIVTYQFAYRVGLSDARDKATADRGRFQTRVAGTPVSVPGGSGQGSGSHIKRMSGQN